MSSTMTLRDQVHEQGGQLQELAQIADLSQASVGQVLGGTYPPFSPATRATCRALVQVLGAEAARPIIAQIIKQDLQGGKRENTGHSH